MHSHTSRYKNIATCCLLTLGLCAPIVHAEPISVAGLSPEDAGRKIVEEAETRAEGFGNSSATLTMTLINKKGQKTLRTMTTKVLEVKGAGNRSLTVFQDPKDVKGTAFLTHAHENKANEQWLYLPAIKRAKRISSNNKSGSFMGSEFSYEDLGRQDAKKYTYTLLGEETFNGVAVYKIQSTPKLNDSGYTKQISWVEKEPLRILKVEYYDRKKSLLKTLTLTDYEKFDNKYWRAKKLFMKNQQSSKATEIRLSELILNDPSIKKRDFTKNALKRSK